MTGWLAIYEQHQDLRSTQDAEPSELNSTTLACPTLSKTAIVSDDPYLAAQLSCTFAEPRTYLPVLDGPRMTRPDHAVEVIRRNNALARLHPSRILLGGLPPDAERALAARLPRGLTTIVTDAGSVSHVASQSITRKAPLRWGLEHVGLGVLTALYTRRPIEFVDDQPQLPTAVRGSSGHVVVCERGELLSEVIAANYAFSLSAGLHMIDATDEVERNELLEAYYSIDASGVSPGDIRARLQRRLREMCCDLPIPPGGSITFISRELPFGAAYPEVPSTHLFQYPDLGVAIVNGFAAEQPATRGTNVAVLVDPGKVKAPEIEAATRLLPERRIFVRSYGRKNATVRAIAELIELFPYDLLIFATHCGDVSGHRWTYEFKDSEGYDRTLVVDIGLGLAGTDDPDVIAVTQYMRFHSLDGVDWADPEAKRGLYVGTAILDFTDAKREDRIEPTKRETVSRVQGSAAMAMADNNLLVTSQSLAASGSPIILNNACVSWHQLASRFTFASARAYVGTLYPVSDAEAEAVMVQLLSKQFGKALPHAVWSAQNAVYGPGGDRRPYVVTGVYPQRLRTTKEDVPGHILKRLRQEWRARAGKRRQSDARDEQANQTAHDIAYYEREVTAFHSKWFGRPQR